MKCDTMSSWDTKKAFTNSRRQSGLEKALAQPAMTPGRLISLCVQLYESFNPSATTLDIHADDFIAKNRLHDPDEVTFLKQVLYGVYRYNKLVDALLSAFYHHHSGTAQRQDANMYAVFAYLALFRLKELSFPQFRRLVRSQDAQKVLVLVKFLFSVSNLESFCRDAWLKIYDKDMVDSLIQGIAGWHREGSELIASLEEKVYLNRGKEGEGTAGSPGSGGGAAGMSGGSSPVRRAGPTVPEPFQITQPRPRPPPIVEPPPPKFKAKPAPKVAEGPTREMVAIDVAKEQNRRQAESKYSDPSLPFKLRVLERPSTLDKAKQEAEKKQAAALTFRPAPPKPVPATPSAEVRMNAAAILREDALYRKKMETEARALMAYEQELRDASEFKKWQAEMISLDEAARVKEIERRRQEMAEAARRAAEARQDLLDNNKENVEKMREEKRKKMARLEAEIEALEAMNRQKRDQIVSDRALVRRAEERIAAERRIRAEELRREGEENERLLLEAREVEMKKKMDVIRQLRALEQAREPYIKEVDPTWTPGQGLLEEMSLAELKERLAMEERRHKEEVERRRQRIIAVKEDKQAMLLGKASKLSKIRRLAHAQAQLRKEQTVQERLKQEAAEAAKREADTLQLYTKLEADRGAAAAERARIAAEEKRIRFEQSQQAASKDAVEEHKFESLREGAEREAHNRQSDALEEAHIYEQTRALQLQTHQENAMRALQDKKRFVEDYDKRLSDMKVLGEKERAEETRRKADLAQTQREWEVAQRAKKEAETYRPGSQGAGSLARAMANLATGGVPASTVGTKSIA